MKCVNCSEEINDTDNFCGNCGHWTANGYKILKNKTSRENVINGKALKQDMKLSILLSLFGLGVIFFVIILYIQGDSLFKPIIYAKKYINNYFYGYNTSMIETNNKYYNEIINNRVDAIEIIKNDFSSQRWLCKRNNDLSKIELSLEEEMLIPSINFCNMSLDIANDISNTIHKMYDLFPNIKGYLTNITISNAKDKSDYIAYFQPIYQFVNINNNISEFNKVNKTQILLNSYYFLNENFLHKDITEVVGKDWYVKDANWNSVIAHELGHYITFVSLLKYYNVDNVTYITKENYKDFEEIYQVVNSGEYSLKIVNAALKNYNDENNVNLNIEEFARTISKYAAVKDKNNVLIADETIAEAIHDYYLHGGSMKSSSSEIVNIIMNILESR